MFSQPQITAGQWECLAKISLAIFSACLWFSSLYKFIVPLLVLTWLLDTHAAKFRQMLIEEPLVQAIVILCAIMLLGLLWSDAPMEGRHKWRKYFLLLVYIPFLGLLNRERLPCVIGALFTGYCFVLSVGLYEWIVENEQGIPVFNMSYLKFSSMLGLGCIIACYLASLNRSRMVQGVLGACALVLLYFQFHQSARGFLLATLITLAIFFFAYFRVTIRKLIGTASLLFLVVILFASISPVLHERLEKAEQDFEQIRQDSYNNSIGYRIAIWDVGVHAIVQRPFFGYGTGMPESHFDQIVVNYKGGIYKDLPSFVQTSHYHNDWIEIGMHVGLLGIVSLMFLFWAWYQTFKRCQLTLFGIAMLSFVFLAGLTEVFFIFGRMPVVMLVVTAIMVCWQKAIPDNTRWNLNRA